MRSRNSNAVLCSSVPNPGLTRAKAEGKPPGRPSSPTLVQQALVRKGIAGGETVSAIARDLGTSRQTIMRAQDAQTQDQQAG